MQQTGGLPDRETKSGDNAVIHVPSFLRIHPQNYTLFFILLFFLPNYKLFFPFLLHATYPLFALLKLTFLVTYASVTHA